MTTCQVSHLIKSPTPKKTTGFLTTDSSPLLSSSTSPKNEPLSPKTIQEENPSRGGWFTRTGVVNTIANIDSLERRAWKRGLPYLTLWFHVPCVALLITLIVCSHLEVLVPSVEFNLKDFQWNMSMIDPANHPLFNQHRDIVFWIGCLVMWLSMIRSFILKKDSITGVAFVQLFRMNISNLLSKKSSTPSDPSEDSLHDALQGL